MVIHSLALTTVNPKRLRELQGFSINKCELNGQNFISRKGQNMEKF